MEVEQNRRRAVEAYGTAVLNDGRWPARAQRLLEASYNHCARDVTSPLRLCLSDFEDQLFKLAERAHRPAEQQDFFTTRQRLLHDRAAFEQRFIARLGAAFNDIDKEAIEASAAAIPTAWQPLELLDPVEQEISLSVAQLGARGEIRHSSVLFALSYRFAALAGTPPLEGSALPIGPHALSRALCEASASLELPLAHHLSLLQSFDQRVIQQIGPLYEAISLQLQDEGILPQLRSLTTPRYVNMRSRGPTLENAATAAASASASETAREGAPPAGSAAQNPASGESIEVLESLRDLLAQGRENRGESSRGGPSGRAASTDELQLALGALQQHLARVTDNAGRELRSAQRLRDELIAQLNINKPADAQQTQLSSEQGDTVDLVALLFEKLGQQLHTGSGAQAVLGNMQLPVLRMAVADKDFFERRGHPARRLLDTVAAAANDWLDGNDDEASRPLAAKLDQLIKRANQEPPTAGLYTTLLADIEHHLGMLTRKAQAAERRHVEAAQGRERLDQARQRAREFMAERIAQSSPRGLLRALLDRAWSDVLALTLLRHGEQSIAFDAQLVITDQLLGRLPVTDRNQLQLDVEAGLQQIGMHAEEAVQVAQRLLGTEAPQTAVDAPSATDIALRLKQHQRLGEQSSNEPVVAPKPEAPVTDASTIDEPRERAIEKHLQQLAFGTWLEFIDQTDGQVVLRKLAWYSRMSGRCLLVSRRGQRGEEMNLKQLAHEIAMGRVSEVVAQREGMLDRAWRSLTGSLRHPANAARQHPLPEPAPR